MKKITLLLFAIYFLFSALHAQPYQFPDSDFENKWVEKKDFDNKPYLEYQTDFFYTLNSLRALENKPLADLTAFREEMNVQSGKYCIRLTSGIVSVGEGFVFLPGMVGTINEEFVKEFLGSGGNVTITKFWENSTPHALEGWYKYKPEKGDSALIDIGMYNTLTEAACIEKLIIKETNIEEWKHFSIEIPEQYWNQYFYYIRTLFVASAGVNFEHLDQCKGQKGSTLWVDNISLRYTNEISQNLTSSLKANAFPNPAHEIVNFELNENFAGKIVVHDLTGRIFMEDKIDGTECQFNITHLSAGNYIYRIMDENTIFAQGKFVVTK
jgi:hypothetical protein